MRFRLKSNKKAVFILPFLIFINSCKDCRYEYIFKIENNCDSNILVYLSSNKTIPQTDKTLIIQKDSSKIILSKYGDLTDCEGPYKNEAMFFIDSITFTLRDTLQTILNFQDIENWNFNTINNNGVFTVSLSNNDFIKK